MRLINARTMELEISDGASARPSYAILPHRWVGGSEVTFEDMQRHHRQWMPAWPKITMCCQQALADGLNYVWIDTCCIDKNSSAELSEAINSMYTWYSCADRYYAYLSDMVYGLYDQLDASSWCQALMPADMVEKIIASEWFTRAWTLQELIAPTQVIFYDTSFRRLGSKADFATEIEQAFAIPAEVLMIPERSWEYTSAVRMSWAARRRATRTEDIPYSLFGLFGVNLPLLYIPGQLPLLASSPADFGDFQDITLPEDTKNLRPYAMTNVGLEIELKIFLYDLNVYVGLLGCKSEPTGYSYGILVARQGDETNTWHRLHIKEVYIVEIQRPEKLKNSAWQKMYIIKDNSMTTNIRRYLHHPDTSHSHIPFYGLNIHAPAFLADYAGVRRPYTLMAYYDWDLKPGVSDRRKDEEYLQPRYSTNVDAHLIPSSHIGLTMSTLIGLRESGRCKSTEQKKVTTEKLATNAAQASTSKTALGLLLMPLMSTGIAGVIMFDRAIHGIWSIKAGFDFDFRPVIFIATRNVEIDRFIRIWTHERRFVPLEWIEQHCYLLESPGVDEGRRLWMLGPEYLKDLQNIKLCDDGSILVDEGVYAFTTEATAGPFHWNFKPYES